MKTTSQFETRPEAGTKVEYVDSMGHWVGGATVGTPNHDSTDGTWVYIDIGGGTTTWRRLSEIRPATR